MRFDLTDLRLFLLVVETGSITHGAVRANLSLPSASARLRGMEEVIGHALLERGRRGVEPTPAGDTLAHHARLVLRQIDLMRGELGEYSHNIRGQIRLLVNTAAMTEFLPAPLASFLAAHPKIDIDLRERRSTDIVKAVAEGFADIGIISNNAKSGALHLIPFTADHLVLLLPKDHDLAGRRRIAFQEAALYDFIGLSEGSPLQDYLGEHALRAGHPLSYRIRMTTFEGICQMVSHRVGVGILPETAARKCRKSVDISWVALTDEWAARQLAICVRALDDLSPHAAALVQHLAAAFPAKPR